MKKVNISSLKTAAQRLVRSTRDNEVKESGLYRCERSDEKIYIAKLTAGRPGTFVEVTIKEQTK